MDCSPPGSSVHGILRARILEQEAIPFSRGSSDTGIKIQSPALQVDSLASAPPRKPQRDQALNQKPIIILVSTEAYPRAQFPSLRTTLFCEDQS